MPSSPAICTGPSRRRHLALTIRLTMAGVVVVGIECGLLVRSAIPAGPSVRYRAAHFRAVGGETMNIFTATDTGHCSSTMSLARGRRARGVTAALAWDTKASCVREVFPRQIHSGNRGPSPLNSSRTIHATTSPRTSHLGPPSPRRQILLARRLPLMPSSSRSHISARNGYSGGVSPAYGPTGTPAC